jgi:two-component system CheB/CheR fusion protein
MTSQNTKRTSFPPQENEVAASTNGSATGKKTIGKRSKPVAASPTTTQSNGTSMVKSESTLRALIEHTKEAFILFASDGSALAFNQVAVDLYRKHNKKELKEGAAIYDLIIPERRKATKEIFDKVLTGVPYERFVDHVADDGKRYFFKRYFNPVKNEQGEIYAIANTITDITSEVEAQTKLRESEERFRTVANTAPVMIWMTNPDKLADFFNTRWIEFTGCTPDQLENFWTAVVHPDDINLNRTAYTNAFDAREEFRLNYRLRRHDGEFRWVEDYGMPRYSDDGLLFLGYIGTCTDITTRKMAREELERNVAARTKELEEKNTEIVETSEKLAEKIEELSQQNEYIETLIDSSIDLITVYDKDMRIITVNKQTEKSLEKHRDELIGKTYLELFPKSKASHTYNNLLKCLGGESTRHFVQRTAYSDHAFDIFMIPLRHHGEVYAALVLVHDITELIAISDKLHVSNKALELKNMELARTNKELEQFAYVASHDLQEPLRKIHTFTGRLKEKASPMLDETSRLWIEKIMHSTDRMSNLIKDILDYSRVNVSHADFLTVDLNKTLSSVLEDFDLRIAEKHAHIDSERLPEIEGIPLYLYQLFHNIIGNALKFSRDGMPPVIRISAAPYLSEIGTPDDLLYWEIIIRDNGIGFSHEFSDRIFTIFQRLNERSKFEGTGVGLALCRKIVEMHNGKIFAESVEGEGSAFHIIVPEKQ